MLELHTGHVLAWLTPLLHPLFPGPNNRRVSGLGRRCSRLSEVDALTRLNRAQSLCRRIGECESNTEFVHAWCELGRERARKGFGDRVGERHECVLVLYG